MRVSYNPQSELSVRLGIGSPFRGRSPLSHALHAACSPEGFRACARSRLLCFCIRTCRRPLLPLVYHQRSPMSAWPKATGNIGRGSRSLPDLTGRFTARTDDGHAPPLSASGKTFSLTFILLSPLVRCPALDPIEPQHSPLVCSPANSLKFQPCDRTPQAARLTVSLRPWQPP